MLLDAIGVLPRSPVGPSVAEKVRREARSKAIVNTCNQKRDQGY